MKIRGFEEKIRGFLPRDYEGREEDCERVAGGLWREKRRERERGKIEGKREVSPWREENSAVFSLFYKFSSFFMRSISFSLTDCQEEEVTS